MNEKPVQFAALTVGPNVWHST